MLRKIRINAPPDALHHIIIRGIEQRKNFIVLRPAAYCATGVRELGMKTVELAKKVNLAQPTVSQAASRGSKIPEKQPLNLMEQVNQ